MPDRIQWLSDDPQTGMGQTRIIPRDCIEDIGGKGLVRAVDLVYIQNEHHCFYRRGRAIDGGSVVLRPGDGSESHSKKDKDQHKREGGHRGPPRDGRLAHEIPRIS